jgi:hypothetical protein
LASNTRQLPDYKKSSISSQPVAGPSTSQAGAPSSSGGHFDRNDDNFDAIDQFQDDNHIYNDRNVYNDNTYNDSTLPPLPGQLSDEEIVDDEPTGDVQDRWDAEPRDSSSNGKQLQYLFALLMSRIANDHSVDDQSSSSGWSLRTDGSSTPRVHSEIENFDRHDAYDGM